MKTMDDNYIWDGIMLDQVDKSGFRTAVLAFHNIFAKSLGTN